MRASPLCFYYVLNGRVIITFTRRLTHKRLCTHVWIVSYRKTIHEQKNETIGKRRGNNKILSGDRVKPVCADFISYLHAHIEVRPHGRHAANIVVVILCTHIPTRLQYTYDSRFLSRFQAFRKKKTLNTHK